MRYWFAAISIVLPVSFMCPALAASQRDADDCNQSGDQDRRIAGCARIIGGADETARDRALAYCKRANAYKAKVDLDRAIADYGAAIDLDPKLAFAYYDRGIAYEHKGDHDRAIADYNEAIRLDPKYAAAYNNRGNAYRAKGDHDRAIAGYDEAIRLDPKDAAAYYNRGNAYNAKGDHDRAIADYNEAIRLEPKFAANFTGRGLAYKAKGELGRAKADFNAALAAPQTSDTSKWAHNTAREELAALTANHQTAASPAPVAPAPAVAAPPAPAAAIATAPAAQPSTPERRVALVIGNSAYPRWRLTNPANDADDVAHALRGVGFDVIERKDLTLEGFSQIIESFRDKAHGAVVDVALFYYSGHAMQFEEQNWLMPIDTRVANAFDARHSNMSLQEMISEIETSAKATLVYLDACRTNPLADELKVTLKAEGRAVENTRGLMRFPVNQQTLVVFATRPNTVAFDGKSRNSPFTEAFLQHLPTPDVEIEVLMKRVTASVVAGTRGRQQPERLSRLEREFYFMPAKSDH